MKTKVTIEFKDEDDKKNFLWIMKVIQEKTKENPNYRMTPLFEGLMNAILRDILMAKEL